jgi:hypothetical protein
MMTTMLETLWGLLGSDRLATLTLADHYEEAGHPAFAAALRVADWRTVRSQIRAGLGWQLRWLHGGRRRSGHLTVRQVFMLTVRAWFDSHPDAPKTLPTGGLPHRIAENKVDSPGKWWNPDDPAGPDLPSPEVRAWHIRGKSGRDGHRRWITEATVWLGSDGTLRLSVRSTRGRCQGIVGHPSDVAVPGTIDTVGGERLIELQIARPPARRKKK